MKMYELQLKFHRSFVPKRPIDKHSSIGPDNGLDPTRWQAIIWTNDFFYIYTDAYMHHSA